MQKTVEATWEGGALHPVEPLLLREHQRVTITVAADTDLPEDHPLLVSSSEWANPTREEIQLADLRRRLSGIHKSLSQTIIDARQER